MRPRRADGGYLPGTAPQGLAAGLAGKPVVVDPAAMIPRALGTVVKQRYIDPAIQAVKAPGDAYAGRLDPLSDEGLARTQGLANLAMTGGMPLAEAGGLGMAGGRMVQPTARSQPLKVLRDGRTPVRVDVADAPVPSAVSRFGLDPDGQAFYKTDPPSYAGGRPYVPDHLSITREIDKFLAPFGDKYVRSVLSKDDYARLASGTHRGSKNHATGESEGGLSVSPVNEFPSNYAYLVSGKHIGVGSDQEPLLDLATARPASPLMTGKKFQQFQDVALARRKAELGLSEDAYRKLVSGGKPILKDSHLPDIQTIGGEKTPSFSDPDVYARGGRVGMANGGDPSVEAALRIAQSAPPGANLAHNVTGPLDAPTPGRTDTLPISVPHGAYVLPADVVSAIGQGNSQAGAHALNRLFGAPPPGAIGKPVDIVGAGGEYVVHPHAVAAVGGGELDRGHAALDALVEKTREAYRKRLAKMPGPKR